MGTAADEARHDAEGQSGWSEVFDLQFWCRDLSFGGFTRFEIRPDEGVCWFWTSLVGLERRLVTVLEFGSPIPRWPGLELRGPSLWCEMIVETPWEHVSLGLEAFAVELEDPAEVFAGARGDLVPLGYDLEWESTGQPVGATGSWEVAGAVHGEILVGPETIDFDGLGSRLHAWGPIPDLTLPDAPANSPLMAPVALPDGKRRAWVLDSAGPRWVAVSR